MGSEMKYLLRGTLMFTLCVVLFHFGKILLNANYPPPAQTAAVIDNYIEPARELSDRAIRGKQIFKENCAACHRLYFVDFPQSLLGVESRWPNRDLLKLWIKDWRKAVATNDPYAIQVSQISKAVMSVFEKLTDDEIESILQYLSEEETRQGEGGEH